MFGIANDIAYNGIMVNGTDPENAARFAMAYPSLPDSGWLDIPTTDSQGHWIPAEGRQLDRLLGTLRALDFDLSRVMVIGPFRDIARGLHATGHSQRARVTALASDMAGGAADAVLAVIKRRSL